MAKKEMVYNNIALFGHTSSGKTTITRAFLRAMSRRETLLKPLTTPGINLKMSYKKNNSHTENWLSVPDEMAVTPYTATQHFLPEFYRIERTPRNTKSPNPRKNVSTSYHYLNLVDDSGGVFDIAEDLDISIERIFAAKDIPAKYLERIPGDNPAERIQIAWMQLARAQVIIVLLDRTEWLAQVGVKAASNPQPQPASKPEVTEMNTAQQASIVSQLRRIEQIKEYLESTENRYKKKSISDKKIVIACVKVDDPRLYRIEAQFKGTHYTGMDDDADIYIETKFGEAVSQAVERLAKCYGNDNVKRILISATGWKNDGTSNQPPITSPSDTPEEEQDKLPVDNIEEWEPYNIVEMFRWIFEALDRKRIADSREKIGGFLGWLSDANSRDAERIEFGADGGLDDYA
jgi:hypothetical protein